MPTPLKRYERAIQNADFIQDKAQAAAVKHLQRLFDELEINQAIPPSRPKGLFAIIHSFVKPEVTVKKPIRGLYFWGGVGRGKTYLVDTFYDCLPFSEKMRIHFHRFMQKIHEELQQLKNVQNPLIIVAKQLAAKTRILCLDEFHVSDITDAMLLGNLLEALFNEGVTLVATSNVPPDELYKEGLQRARFLPAIALIKAHTEVVNIDGGIDYRLRTLEQAEIYHYPLDTAAEQNLLITFHHLSPEECIEGQILVINAREIPTVMLGNSGIVWFDFQILCNVPRGVADYIELARCFNTVLLSNVYCMNEFEDDKALRLINLVDEFYDRNVKLIISAEAPPNQLYTGYKQQFQFQRTISRLEEMRSEAYLKRPHLP